MNKFKNVKTTDFFSNLNIVLIVLYKFLLIYKVNYIFPYIILFFVAFFTVINVLKIRKYAKRSFYMIVFISAFSLFICYKNRSANCIFPCLVAFNCINKDYKSIVKTFCTSIVIMTIITITLNLVGIIPSHNLVRYDSLGGNSIRYSLGFIHPNSLFNYLSLIIFGYYYVYGFNNKQNFFFIILSIIAYRLTLSRTGLACIIIFYFLIYLENYLKIKFSFKLVPYLIIIMTIFTFVSIKLYDTFDLTQVDSLLSNRLYYGSEFIKNGGTSYLLPNVELRQKIDSGLIVVDNLYLSLFSYYGVIGFVLIVYFYIKSLKKLKHDKKIMIIAIVMLISGFTETNAILYNVNFLASIQMIALIKNRNYEVET